MYDVVRGLVENQSMCVEVLGKLKLGKLRDEESECLEEGAIEERESEMLRLVIVSKGYEAVMVDVSVCVEVVGKLKVGRLRDEESECVEVVVIEEGESRIVCLVILSIKYVDQISVEVEE